ncbi:hypothetical protein BDN72DRAFT_733796, partial [Pluteus cervinus]
CLSGTRQPVLQSIKYWTADRSSKIFWLHGIAGTGKSTVAESVFRALDQSKKLGAYFTCRRDETSLNNPLNVLPTIAYQLGMTNPTYGQALLQVLKADTSFEMSLGYVVTQCTKLFAEPISLVDSNDGLKVVVIDALDELGHERDQVALLSILLKLVESCSWIKVLVTSRPFTYITEFMKEINPVQYELNVSNSKNDIFLYIQSSISSQVTSNWLSSLACSHMELLATLTKLSNGLFIWAHTACMLLKSSQDFVHAFYQITQAHHPSESPNQGHSHLHALYTVILDQTFSSPENISAYQIVLGSILLAIEPVSVQTLSRLLSTQIPSNVVTNIVQSLQNLLFINNQGKIQIIHPSLADFLLHPQSARFYIDSSKMQQFMVQQCLLVLSKQLKFNICQLETSYKRNSDVLDLDTRVLNNISSELQYACLYWVQHIIQCSNTIEPALSSIFITLKTLFWIECLSLLGKLDVGLHSIRQLELWLKPVNSGQNQSYEVYCFMSKFYIPIYTSTPHLYISALSFAPHTSLVYKTCKTGFPQRILLKSQSDKYWRADNVILSGKTNATSLVLHPLTNLIYSVSSDKILHLWNPYSGQSLEHRIIGHCNSISALALKFKENVLITGSSDCTIRFWDLHTFKSMFQPLNQHNRKVHSLLL